MVTECHPEKPEGVCAVRTGKIGQKIGKFRRFIIKPVNGTESHGLAAAFHQ